MAPLRSELRGVTGLRFLAALHILLFHALFTFPGPAAGARLPETALTTFLRAGHVGVNLFFVLSGFILVYAHAGDDGRLAIPARAFWAARFARIYPLHIFGILLALPLFVLGSRAAHASEAAIAREGAMEFAACASLLQAWWPRFALTLNGPAWSLSAEAFFYACFPLLARTSASFTRRKLVIAMVAVWGVSLLVTHLAGEPLGRAPSESDVVAMFNPLLRLPDFILGVALGCTLVRGGARPPSVRWDLATFLALALAIAILASGRLPFLALHNGLLSPLWGVILYGLARGNLVSRVLGWTPLVSLGRASFALYVIHKPLFFWMRRAWPRPAPMHAGGESILFVLTYVAIAIAASLLLRSTFEEPMRRWLRRISRSHPPSRRAA